ncbi:MAG TPA: hypothetical protein VHE09_12015 [Rhizomicrobium sp.]|nr:hypothetical protein [Rhizomicrobium sp.]
MPICPKTDRACCCGRLLTYSRDGRIVAPTTIIECLTAEKLMHAIEVLRGELRHRAGATRQSLCATA